MDKFSDYFVIAGWLVGLVFLFVDDRVGSTVLAGVAGWAAAQAIVHRIFGLEVQPRR